MAISVADLEAAYRAVAPGLAAAFGRTGPMFANALHPNIAAWPGPKRAAHRRKVAGRLWVGAEQRHGFEGGPRRQRPLVITRSQYTAEEFEAWLVGLMPPGGCQSSHRAIP